MRSVVLKVFLFDGTSKLFMAASSLLLIKYLSVYEYSIFITIFTFTLLVYQGICSVIERLYIAEHKRYISQQLGVKYLLLTVGCGGFSFYIFFYHGLTASLIFLLLVLISVNYQVERIKLQKLEKYNQFIIFEFLRNICWFILVILTVLFVKNDAEYISLLGYALSTGVMLILLRRIPSSTNKTEINITSAAKYLGNKKEILLYSLIAAIFPYLAFISAGILGNEKLIATYGAALRYQAIFSMAVYAANAVLISKMANNIGSEKQILCDFKKVLPWLLLAVIPASMVVWWLIPFIDDGKYPGTQVSFIILVFCSLCSLIATPFVNILLVNNKYKKMLFSLIAGVIVFLILLPVLYQHNNNYGILFALVLAYFVILFFNISFANKQMSNESINS